MHAPLLLRYALNTRGTDWAVGDLHGCYAELEQALREVGFNPATDRLFSVGDLIDRGPQSNRFAEFLAFEWFHALRGNHEQMMLDSVEDRSWELNWFENGGTWSKIETSEQIAQWNTHLERLPLAMEIETPKGLVAMIHADPMFPTWGDTRAYLKQLEATADPASWWGKTPVMGMLWSRRLIHQLLEMYTEKQPIDDIPDICALVIGHTPLTQPLQLGNVWAIDTGACYRDASSALTLLNLHTFKMHSVPCLPLAQA